MRFPFSRLASPSELTRSLFLTPPLRASMRSWLPDLPAHQPAVPRERRSPSILSSNFEGSEREALLAILLGHQGLMRYLSHSAGLQLSEGAFEDIVWRARGCDFD